jgi:signal transduction histidine kinase
MALFFRPISKVQKDRQVMRETDLRMAKYSRRGLFFHIIAFTVTVLFGQLYQVEPKLVLGLAIGLLLTTLLRGYYLFRVEQLYPRGPARWRNIYFIVTLLGSIWWGFILASITFVLELEDRSTLLWLYTVVFFSVTANAFAPYHRFLAYYQFFGLVPAAAAAIAIGSVEAYLYGCLMLGFFLVLAHQCRLLSDTYWEKLEVAYALSRGNNPEENNETNSLDSLALCQDFLSGLTDESTDFSKLSRAELLDRIESNHTKYRLFSEVLSHDLALTKTVFNVRHEIQAIVSEFEEIAESNQTVLETALSSNLPMRLIGDPERFGRIVRTLLTEVVTHSEKTLLVLEAYFLRDYEQTGELFVNIRSVGSKSKFAVLSADTPDLQFAQSTDMTLARGFAEVMDGEIFVESSEDGNLNVRFSARLEIADRSGKLDFHKNCFVGKSILLVAGHPSILDIKRQELEALGFDVTTELRFSRAFGTLEQGFKNGNPIEHVLIYHEFSRQCEELLQKLQSSADLKKIVTKIIAISPAAHTQFPANEFGPAEGFYFIGKPIGTYELESLLSFINASRVGEDSENTIPAGDILVVSASETESESIADECRHVPNQTVKSVGINQIENALSQSFHPIIIVVCDSAEDAEASVQTIRNIELANEDTAEFMPVIGVGQRVSEAELHAYEIGLDDYISLASQRSKTLSSVIRYWRSLES